MSLSLHSSICHLRLMVTRKSRISPLTSSVYLDTIWNKCVKKDAKRKTTIVLSGPCEIEAKLLYISNLTAYFWILARKLSFYPAFSKPKTNKCKWIHKSLLLIRKLKFYLWNGLRKICKFNSVCSNKTNSKLLCPTKIILCSDMARLRVY